ncbi:MAG: YebC/PmpR family DNA-binding transcriptional regulator [Thiohalospira sp.]|uniref:YebC/PmpR family DNA-binding transcriptional regulator n=1 Tax=Thiohalorhabdus sp. TaxID=3094134 RepID=UPI003980D54E
MAGHSKWANIKHRKAAQDAKRGKIFTRLIKEITVAARLGGGDPEANPRLRQAIDKALSNNMPKDNIDRAVKRGTGELEGVSYEEATYEGYAPGGVAVLVECMTDNKNRTVGEIRHIFSKAGGNLGEDGSAAYIFHKTGMLIFDGASVDEDALMEAAMEAGADDIQTEDGQQVVYTDPQDFEDVKAALVESGFEPQVAEVTMKPDNTVRVEGDKAEKVLKLLDALEDHDDVQNVYANYDIPDEVFEQVSV